MQELCHEDEPEKRWKIQDKAWSLILERGDLGMRPIQDITIYIAGSFYVTVNIHY